MIRNLIDYSEYRIQRSNFESWDQLLEYMLMENMLITETYDYGKVHH